LEFGDPKLRPTAGIYRALVILWVGLLTFQSVPAAAIEIRATYIIVVRGYGKGEFSGLAVTVF
jgi:hypothetical protein